MLTDEQEQKVWRDAMYRLRKVGGRIVYKRGWFWITLHYLVMAITFGGNRKFLTGYYTTIGPWVGVPVGWTKRHQWQFNAAAVIEHEIIHIKQCQKFGFGNAMLGLPLYTLCYLLLPLPIGFAYARWRFEREAYCRGIEVVIEHYPNRRTRLIETAVMQLSGSSYAWTWVFEGSMRKWFEANVPKSRNLRVDE